MDFIFEILFEVYLELMMYIVPEEKVMSTMHRFLAVTVAFVVILGNLALFVWGGILIFEKKNDWGYLPFIIATILSLIQIILGVIINQK